MGRTFKYYPSSPFSPSVALGALLTRNLVVVPCMSVFISLLQATATLKGQKGQKRQKGFY